MELEDAFVIGVVFGCWLALTLVGIFSKKNETT